MELKIQNLKIEKGLFAQRPQRVEPEFILAPREASYVEFFQNSFIE